MRHVAVRGHDGGPACDPGMRERISALSGAHLNHRLAVRGALKAAGGGQALRLVCLPEQPARCGLPAAVS
jgi:hypothetical protein